MRLFQSADVLELSGLTRSQLREWCSRDRRDLIRPDVEANGPGRHALYEWQTVLVLRILIHLHREYGVEVGAWAPAISDLRRNLNGVSFPSLWNCCVHFPSMSLSRVVPSSEVAKLGEGIVLQLQPHLLVLAQKLAISPPKQLHLFPARAVRS